MHEVERQAVVEEARRNISRKGFLLGAAGVVGAGALMGLPGTAKAHETEPDVPDSLILNYALTLEHLEATFYQVGVQRFRRQLDRAVYRNLLTVKNHERRHVTLLTAVINSLTEDPEAQPVPRLQYNFQQTAFTNVNRFLTVAALLENTGVSAYDGAIAHITSAEYLTAGAQIATVEARHAAYLNSVKGNSPFPNALDDAVPPQDVATIVRDTFVTSDPTAGPYGPYDNYNAFLGRLPDTLQPDVAGTSARGSNDVNARETLEEAEEAAE